MRPQSKALKRSRGEIACAECRRLKIKCDRKIPCATCVKRGCPSLCPNGTIPPGEGSRSVLAATEHLAGEMARMEARMHALEDALAISQQISSSEPHPLLSAAEKAKLDADAPPEESEDGSEEQKTESVEGAPGTLFVGAHGISRFFGPSGGSESILHQTYPDPDASDASQLYRPELDPSFIPSDVNEFYQSFPFTPVNRPPEPVQAAIEALLPTHDRAIELVRTFLEHTSWMTQIVTRKEIVDTLIPAVYKRTNVIYGPHDLALLLVVMSIGALVDLKMEPYNVEGQYYYRLARAAATLQPVLAQQSIVTIKMLHLMSIYNGFTGIESNLEQSFALLNLAGQIAMRIGFHIDPSSWGFEGQEAYDRRNYFWNLVQGSFWQSIVTGRPPSILPSFVECRIPTAEDEERYQAGEFPKGFGIWGCRSTRECLIHVTMAILSAKPPSYDTVLELDQKIRDLVDPEATFRRAEIRGATSLSMQTFPQSHYPELMLLFLHRAYFAQAMMENPDNPLAGSHGKSVTVAYQSACTILDDTRTQFQKQPLLCARVWRIWTFAFSAAVVVGTVAIQGRGMNLQPCPLQQFTAACDVFRQAAQTSWRAARLMPVLEKMLNRAHEEGLSRFGLGRQPQQISNEEIGMFGEGQIPVRTSGRAEPQPQRQRQQRHALVQQQAVPRSVEPSMDFTSVPSLPRAGLNLPAEEPATSFAALSQGWEGLFHETSTMPAMFAAEGGIGHSSYSHGDSATLDDRWSSFMHNYGVLDMPPTAQQP